jgi:hypothetical protein
VTFCLFQKTNRGRWGADIGKAYSNPHMQTFSFYSQQEVPNCVIRSNNMLFSIICPVHGYMVDKVINGYLTLIYYFQQNKHYAATGEGKVAQACCPYHNFLIFYISCIMLSCWVITYITRPGQFSTRHCRKPQAQTFPAAGG